MLRNRFLTVLLIYGWLFVYQYTSTKYQSVRLTIIIALAHAKILWLCILLIFSSPVADLVLKDKIFVYDLANQRIGWVNYDCKFYYPVERLCV